MTHKLEDDGGFYMYLCADSTLRASQVFCKIADNLSTTSTSVRLLSVITQAVLQKKIRFFFTIIKKCLAVAEIFDKFEFSRSWFSRTEKHCVVCDFIIRHRRRYEVPRFHLYP